MKEQYNYDLKKHTTFKIGGKAKVVCFPKNTEELIEALKRYPDALVLGGCSDVLISSEGIDTEVILTTGICENRIEGTKIYADCGVRTVFSRAAYNACLSGAEFLIGIPATIGGVIYMNASAHNQSISDIFDKCKIFDRKNKKIVTLNRADMEFSYRSSIVSRKDYVILSAEFNLKNTNPVEIKTLIDRNIEFRKQRQPSLVMPNAGSVFKNPEGDSAGRLLEKAGLKSQIIGDAKVWENHANFIVNLGNATSNDVLKLMLRMYNEVKVQYGTELEPEIKFHGKANGEEKEIWRTLTKK